jgi:hypothetical protein
MEASRARSRSRSRSPSQRRSPHKDTHHNSSSLSNNTLRQFHKDSRVPSHRTSHYRPHISQQPRSSRSSEVDKVIEALEKENYDAFIDYYIDHHDRLHKSVRGGQTFFINFIHTCRMCLLSNKRYYTYFIEKIDDKEYGRCIPVTNGPTKLYSGLLVHIIKNAETYDKATAAKIHRLLMWFEQEGITSLIIIPYDEDASHIFDTYEIGPGYRKEIDGTMTYCSFTGAIFSDGMEISNTRVNALLNKIYKLGDGDGGGGGGGSHRRDRRRDRRRSSATRSSKRGVSSKRRTRRSCDDSRRRR